MAKKILVLFLLFTLFTSYSTYAAKVTPWTVCNKLNSQEIYKGKIYTCIKLGKKLYWNNGVRFSVVPSATPTPQTRVTSLPSSTPTPTPTLTPTPTPISKRTCPTNISANWDVSGNLNVSFEKPFLEDGVTRDNRIRIFSIVISAPGLEPIYSSVRSVENIHIYTWQLSQADNEWNFGNRFQKSLSGKLESVYSDGGSICDFAIADYKDSLCEAIPSAPVVISKANRVSVSWQDPSTIFPIYKETRVYVSESNNPYSWEIKHTGKGPAEIVLFTLSKVYLKVIHISRSGCQSKDSQVVESKSLDPIKFDNTPPDEVVNPSATWNAGDLIVSFKLPADPSQLPTTVKVHLTSMGISRIFEKSVTSLTANSNFTVVVSRLDLINAFGFIPVTFSDGSVTNLDSYRNENKIQVPILGIKSLAKP